MAPPPASGFQEIWSSSSPMGCSRRPKPGSTFPPSCSSTNATVRSARRFAPKADPVSAPLGTNAVPAALRPTLPAWAEMSAERVAHVERVAALAFGWAEAMGVPDPERNRWLRAVWLHDALRDAGVETLSTWASSSPGPLELWHGPAAAA